MLRGEYTEIYKAGPKVYRPAVLAFYPAGEVHRTAFPESGARLFSLEIDPYRLWQLGGSALAFHRPLEFSNGVLPMLFLKLYREFCLMDHVSGLAIEGLLLEILAETFRFHRPISGRVPDWLAKAREMLHEHFSERLTATGIAGFVGVHPVHLARAFRPG